MKQPRIYTLELPLDKEVLSPRQTNFRSFLKDLGSPIQYTFVSQYFKGRFRVSAAKMPNGDDNFGRTASVKVKNGVNELTISRFASKLNVATSLDSESRDISIYVDTSTSGKPVLTAEIKIKTLAAEMALTNVWAVIESNTR